MRAKDIVPGMAVEIKVSGRLQYATVLRLANRTDRGYGLRPDREYVEAVVRYRDPRGHWREVSRRPAALRPPAGSELAKRERERRAKAASKPRKPRLYDVSREHAMVPFGGNDGVVARARAYVDAALAYEQAKAKRAPEADIPAAAVAAQRAWLKECLRRHWTNRETYIRVQLGERAMLAPNATITRIAQRAERISRHLFEDRVRVAMLGRNCLASWAGRQALGVADGYGSAGRA